MYIEKSNRLRISNRGNTTIKSKFEIQNQTTWRHETWDTTRATITYVKDLTKFIEEIWRCRAKGEKTVNLDRKTYRVTNMFIMTRYRDYRVSIVYCVWKISIVIERDSVRKDKYYPVVLGITHKLSIYN